MVRVVKKRKEKKRFNVMGAAVILFMFSACAYLASSLFLRSYNNSLSTAAQSLDVQIADIETKNNAVQAEIQTLSSSDRVGQIAASDGMSRNQSNVVTITSDNADGE
jgi:cell division protein FtsL